MLVGVRIPERGRWTYDGNAVVVEVSLLVELLLELSVLERRSIRGAQSVYCIKQVMMAAIGVIGVIAAARQW